MEERWSFVRSDLCKQKDEQCSSDAPIVRREVPLRLDMVLIIANRGGGGGGLVVLAASGGHFYEWANNQISSFLLKRRLSGKPLALISGLDLYHDRRRIASHKSKRKSQANKILQKTYKA